MTWLVLMSVTKNQNQIFVGGRAWGWLVTGSAFDFDDSSRLNTIKIVCYDYNSVIESFTPPTDSDTNKQSKIHR